MESTTTRSEEEFKDLGFEEGKQNGERLEVVIARIGKQFTDWRQTVHSLDQVEILRLNGLSNACYRVKLNDNVVLSDPDTPRVVIYRKYECDIIDLHIEKAIFKSMSDSGIGPRLFYQGDNYRIEEYIEGR